MSTHYPHETIAGDWHALIATESIRMRTMALQMNDLRRSYPQLSTTQSQHNTSLCWPRSQETIDYHRLSL